MRELLLRQELFGGRGSLQGGWLGCFVVCCCIHTFSFVVICLFVSAFTGGILKQAVGHFWGYTPRFFEKLFTAEPRPGDPRTTGFLTFLGDFSSRGVSNGGTPPQIFEEN